MSRRHNLIPGLLLAGGLVAFIVAGLSIVDMFLPRPWDGVVLRADTHRKLRVREVVPGTGADGAGIRPGDQIVGIDRNVLRSTAHAATLLNRYDIGQTVPYLVRNDSGLWEVGVELGRRRIGNPVYLYACLLGFAFYFVGLFVLLRQPTLRPAQIFFLLCVLFLLFLVCRLRPASYTWVDSFVLTTGMVALLFLPASFLHFFLVFPRPVPLRPDPGSRDYTRRRRRWLVALGAIYALPPVVLLASQMLASGRGEEMTLLSGAPIANWWVLAAYMLLGLGTLAVNSRRLTHPLQRRGAALVLAGSLFGLLPFLTVAVAFPELLHKQRFLFVGLLPLAIVPLTFAYAIVRFELLDIRVIVRKSLLYTLTTAAVTSVYALGIALFNSLAGSTRLAASPIFPIVFALAIVLLFEPLRRQIQVVVERFYYAERKQLEAALREMGSASAAHQDPGDVVADLVERLPQVLGLRFAALYLVRDASLQRVAGPEGLPPALPTALVGAPSPERQTGLSHLRDRSRPSRLRELAGLLLESPELDPVTRDLSDLGVELVADLATPRRRIGVLLLSGTSGRMKLDHSEIQLLERLLDQTAMALETSLLLEERTRQAELEREVQIAASIQANLLPSQLSLGPGWSVAAICRPARDVGGDFYTELPGPREGSCAVVYGDVAGKSVSGALMMMAAHEALHSLTLIHREPDRLFGLANQRLYGLGKRKSFVALAYLTADAQGQGIEYILAGQPQPMLRTTDGRVEEVALPEHRLPLGALINGSYKLSRAPMACGDLLLGYSDGVVEAQSPAGEIFGGERLATVLAGAPAEAAGVLTHVMAALENFTQGCEPYDDITLVAVARDPEAPGCESSGPS